MADRGDKEHAKKIFVCKELMGRWIWEEGRKLSIY